MSSPSLFISDTIDDNQWGFVAPLPPGSTLRQCDSADAEIDRTAALREALMEDSLGDKKERAGLFWPDGDGGYTLKEFGVDIPGGGPGPCGFESPPRDSFPPADEWPSGVIAFHTHPYMPGEIACGGQVRAGPSPDDRDYLGWIRENFSEDAAGMVMDEMAIYRYGETVDEDKPPKMRCQ